MKKILAVCASPMQTMFVINLKHTFFKNDIIDVIFTDSLSKSEVLADRAYAGKVFRNAYSVKYYSDMQKNRKTRFSRLTNTLLGKYKSRRKAPFIKDKDHVYDIFLFNNIDYFTSGVFENLYGVNDSIQACYYEDGYSTYCIQGDYVNDAIAYYSKWFIQIIKKWFCITPLIENIHLGYLYSPSSLEWIPKFKTVKVPQLDINNFDLIHDLNVIYDYDNLVDRYDENVIFFEESYRTEGILIDDLSIVENIANWIGKENILIKKHPRNNDNVFSKLGYKTNTNIEVPWEVIVANNLNVRNKLLISVASGSIATPYTMFGINTRSIVLFDMDSIKPSGFLPRYYAFLNTHIFSSNPEIFKCPQNYIELKKYIDEFEITNIVKRKNY